VTFPGALVINPADIATNSTKETFLATVRGRLGWTAGNALIYGTGGLAIGTVNTNDTFCSFGCPAGTPADLASVSGNTTRTGWTGGGGVEYHLMGNWSAKVEYLYVNLGTFSTSIPSCAACAAGSDITVSHKFTDNIARIGLNLHY
jgi:outer membrane immunogenic protein